jgi:hypothetical protein
VDAVSTIEGVKHAFLTHRVDAPRNEKSKNDSQSYI